MKYSFTGPAHLTEAQIVLARVTVDRLPEIAGTPTEITTGGATGWDTEVALIALELWPEATHRVVLPRAPYNTDGYTQWLEWADRLGIRHETVWGPDRDRGPKAYRGRNELLAASGQLLIAGLLRPGFYRSGEWMTVNIARKLRIPTYHIDLSGGPS